MNQLLETFHKLIVAKMGDGCKSVKCDLKEFSREIHSLVTTRIDKNRVKRAGNLTEGWTNFAPKGRNLI
jgi:hypothetical protein